MGARAARAGKSSGSSKKLKIIIPIAVIVLILVVGGFFAFDIFNDFKGANVSEEKSIVKIAESDTIKEVAAKLKDAGIIKYSWAAEAFYKIKDFKRDFIAGDIELNKNSSYTDIFDKIIQPKTARQTVSIRFPEGSEVKDIVQLFLDNGIGSLEKFNDVIANYDFHYDFIPEPGAENRLEGYLYPDTYEFYVDSSEQQVLQKLIDTFYKKMSGKDVKDAVKNSGMELSDLIKLASVVEKEAGAVEDMKNISSVFHNRLEKDMKLESCATLNYTIEKSERRLALTNEQMKSDSPYNTYKYKGLPPTPISNPGIDAILAAARPADTNYLYLCAMGDGRTAFATTLSGHEKNIAKYKDNW